MPGLRPPWLTDLLEDLVHRAIREDQRTRDNPGTYLGWPLATIFRDVLGAGQADFDEPIGHLTPDDRALLYARFNQPRHLDELDEAFSILFGDPDIGGKPTIIDIGCGPFTAGLAVATALRGTRPFRYYGVDRATSMCRLGEQFASAARTRAALHVQTTVEFTDDLDELDFGPIRGDMTIAVASYLLSSKRLDVDELVRSMVSAFDRIGPGPAAILYTNSAKPYPNRKYPAFQEGLLRAGFSVRVDAEEVFRKTGNPSHLRYALFYRVAKLRVPLVTP